jgi:hypothetical protein
MQADIPTTDTDANQRWSASVRVNTRNREPAFYVRVGGQPQHVIASADFAPLAEDRELGSFEWQDIVATMSVEEDRHAIGVWPDAQDLASDIDGVRVLRIQAGRAYRLDYMPDGTVLGVNPVTGALIKSPSPQWVNDDRDALTNLARVAYQWYGRERRIFQLQTLKIFNELSIGDLIVSVSRTDTDDQDIGTVVTQIALELPRSSYAHAAPASMSIFTAYADLDPLRI